VDADLSVHEIEVSVGFTGSKLLVFGAVKKRADVVVVVEGPPVHAKLWAKKRKWGFWVNERPETFDNVPGFYAIASSKPLSKIAQPATVAHYGLTLDALFFPYRKPQGAYSDESFHGLKQSQQARNLYQENEGVVHISKGGLFRADFDLPAAVPIGAYQAHIYLLRSGNVFATQEVPLAVNRIGIEASINHLAYDRPFAYAFLALLSSLGLGGGAAYLFRRRA
jgi:uncharacterized protein (TIGR02186 family)